MLLVCSGGSCSGDLMKSQAINFSTSTALLTLSFANQIVLKRRAVSTDAGATYSFFASPTEAPGAHFTCFTGTKNYFFFSTNTHAEGALQSRTSRW
jgi:hypothetical protein